MSVVGIPAHTAADPHVPVNAAKPHRYEALDSLRGICALCVCLFHFRVNCSIADLSFVHGSWLFVDFFFVLSGFVIAVNYRQRLASGMALGDFALLRLGRVYPLHVVMLAAFVVMELVGVLASQAAVMERPAFDDAHSLPAILSNLLLLNANGLHDRLTWNQPSWSIAAEFWTYLLFAVAARAAGNGLRYWLVAAAVVSAAFLFFHGQYGINVTYDWGLVRCIYGFAIGVLIAQRPPRPAAATVMAGWATLIEVAMAVAVIAFVSFAGPTRANVAAPLVFAAALLVFARQGGAISRLLLTPPLLWLGVLSYSIYMVHVFVQARMDDVLKILGRVVHVPMVTRHTTSSGVMDFVGGDPAQGAVLTIVMLALVILTARITWQLVEVPGQEWSRRIVARRRSSAPR